MIKKLGILGGMGPAASAEFLVRLIQQTPVERDQDHIPTILWSDPTVPDRSISMRNGDDKPLPQLIQGIRGLKAMGCDLIVIPCNTAHFWFHEFSKINVQIVHIVDSVANTIEDVLGEVNDHNSKIGILGTQATIELGLYQYKLNKLGWNCITPSQEEMDSLVQPAINLIKAQRGPEAYSQLMTVIDSLIDRGASAVVLGCTEIPLVVRESMHQNIPLISSIDSLVQYTIKQFKRN